MAPQCGELVEGGFGYGLRPGIGGGRATFGPGARPGISPAPGGPGDGRATGLPAVEDGLGLLQRRDDVGQLADPDGHGFAPDGPHRAAHDRGPYPHRYIVLPLILVDRDAELFADTPAEGGQASAGVGRGLVRLRRIGVIRVDPDGRASLDVPTRDGAFTGYVIIPDDTLNVYSRYL